MGQALTSSINAAPDMGFVKGSGSCYYAGHLLHVGFIAVVSIAVKGSLLISGVLVIVS